MNQTAHQMLEEIEDKLTRGGAEVQVRRGVLESAIQCVCHDRQDQHGKPENSFAVIAELWNTYIEGRPASGELDGKDVAWMMVLLKVARSMSNPTNLDNAIDASGYAALAAELALD